MGQEIESSEFSAHDFAEFQRRLKRETELLAEWFDAGVFASEGAVGVSTTSVRRHVPAGWACNRFGSPRIGLLA
ncbi:MAG: hypothetical protein AB2825_12470 [Candidatus Thiodiazotropha endolucinida]